ncbi:MAG: glutamate-5-semialdehyde dehydrogenase [Corynebacterium sp.]|nr:glutamate-5-semialdehyde dehydrogenase [Corynebacterium sp.]
MTDTPTEIVRTVRDQAARAKQAARIMRTLPRTRKDELLLAAAAALRAQVQTILSANAADVAAATGDTDRLRLDADRVEGIAHGLELVAGLPDPVGEVVEGRVMYNGIRMKKIRVPLGVMGMVYEARPNVTVDAFGLAIKAGNVVLLRGSKTAAQSNATLVSILREVLENQGLPADAVQLLPSQSHDSVQALITARGLVDVVIPRGGAGLINAVVENATVPTIETGVGNCHLYIDADADVDQAIAMLINGKTRRPTVCNATETVLLDAHLDEADQVRILSALAAANVRVHGDPDELAGVAAQAGIEVIAAAEKDWAEEYLTLDIAAKRVGGVHEALDHIATYSSGHTEAIATQNTATAAAFVAGVDAAAVSVNASTAFTDGEQYGMGAEIGISTQKLHARGPMALPELTTFTWVLEGDGHTRA